MPNIAVLMSRWTPQNNEVVRGIYDFAHSLPDWNVQPFEGQINAALSAALGWQAQAFILLTDAAKPNSTDLLSAMNQPVTLVGTRLTHTCSWPAITINVDSYGQLLSQHLQNIKPDRTLLILQSEDEGLTACLTKLYGDGLSKLLLGVGSSRLLSTQPEPTEELSRWFTQPRGHSVVIAGDDEVAVYVRRLAGIFQWQVPHELAIISLRDGLSLGLPAISVTSVVQPNHELGYQAARMTHRILSGQPAPTEPWQVNASHLVCRASSVEAGQDLAIERAVKFIDENATRGITVSEVMAFQQTSRVTFERQFQATMGCTPGEYIRRIKVQKACDLLSRGTQTIESIGKACGYHSPAKFSSFFKRAMGISPALYRRQSQSSNT